MIGLMKSRKRQVGVERGAYLYTTTFTDCNILYNFLSESSDVSDYWPRQKCDKATLQSWLAVIVTYLIVYQIII